MRAALLEGPFKVIMTEVPDIEPKDHEVKIRVNVTGICGSEVHAFKGTHPYRKPPVVLGHELAGDVVEVGAQIKHLKIGDRVTVEPQIVCGHCPPCKLGWTNLCNNKIVLGTGAWSGSFAEYIVAPESVVLKLPDNISYEEAVMVEPLAVGVHAIGHSGMVLGDNVLVLGAGTIGLVSLMAAKAAGAKDVFVTDVVDYNLDKARELGATQVINVRKQDPVAAILDATNGIGVDVAFVTAGMGPVVQQGLQTIRKKGKVVVIALFESPINMEMFPLISKEVDLRGCLMYTGEDFAKTLQMMADGRFDVKPLISEIMSIEQTQEGLEVVDSKSRDVAKILLKF